MCFKQGRTLANHVLQNEFSGYNMENNWSLDQYRHSEMKKTESLRNLAQHPCFICKETKAQKEKLLAQEHKVCVWMQAS